MLLDPRLLNSGITVWVDSRGLSFMVQASDVDSTNLLTASISGEKIIVVEIQVQNMGIIILANFTPIDERCHSVNRRYWMKRREFLRHLRFHK